MRGMHKWAAVGVVLAVGLASVANVSSRPGPNAVIATPGPKVLAGVHVQSVARATHLTNNQVRNARTIVAVVVARNLPRRAAVIALAAAMQESKLRNVHYGDRDSLGLFQQRPSMGWGTKAQVLDPRHAARRFLDSLRRLPRWRTMAVTRAAQDVQHSAFPKAYAHWAPLAGRLADALLAKPDAAGTPPAPAAASWAARPSRWVTLSRKRRSRPWRRSPFGGPGGRGRVRCSSPGQARGQLLGVTMSGGGRGRPRRRGESPGRWPVRSW